MGLLQGAANCVRKVAWVTLICSLFLNQTAFGESVLDLPICDRVRVSKGVTRGINQVTKSSSARSLSECAIKCIGSSVGRCNAAILDDYKVCYELNEQTASNSTDSVIHGDIVELIAFGEHSDCSGVECSTQEVCVAGCGNRYLETPMCVADQSSVCDVSRLFTNLRYYWAEVDDSRDSATVLEIKYDKQREETGLRVNFNAAVLGHYRQENTCSQWVIMFDGDECSNPQTIDMVDYSQNGGAHHRTMSMDGTCYGLAAGRKTIKVSVRPCADYFSSNSHTGSETPTTILVMETPSQNSAVPDSMRSCPALNSFNYYYESWVDVQDVVRNLTQEEILVKTAVYHKLATDSSLRIKFSMVVGLVMDNDNNDFCARWYVKINEEECSPKLDFILAHNDESNYNYFRNYQRTRTGEGICNNITAGKTTIEIWIGECGYESQPTNTITGRFSSPSRLHIEEVRTDQVLDGVATSIDFYRSHQGKLSYHHYWKSNFGENDAIVYSTTYNKHFADTGLRLTASGGHRATSSNLKCANWYFMIDGAHCQSPGKILGSHSFGHTSEYEQPMQVSGVCQNILQGIHAIDYNVGPCPGTSSKYIEMGTGWGSSFHIIVEELRLDAVMACSGSQPVICDN